MPPTKPFLLTLAAVAIAAAGIVATPRPREAAAQEGIPLSTKLTPAMIDFFGLAAAYERPSMADLAACKVTPACGSSDSSQVHFADSSGGTVPVYDGKPGSVIETIRHTRATLADGATESRAFTRQYALDDRGHVVMNGLDSIVKIDRGAAGREPTTLVRVHRYADVRYLVNDPRFLWPLTGIVVLELTNMVGKAQQRPVRTATHAAVSFDGTAFAHVLTTGALTHRVNLQAKLLETSIPDR